MKRELLMTAAIIAAITGEVALAGHVSEPVTIEAAVETRLTEVKKPDPVKIEKTVSESEESKPVINVTDEEKSLIARLVQSEAGNQDMDGRRLVARVVINRLEQGFADDIHGVIYAYNQFTPAMRGVLDWIEADEDSIQAVQDVIDGWDESQGATYFHTGVSNWHKNNLKWLFTHGDHEFYR